jgi:O-antigen/teichoic acid export membrane protein
MIVQLFKIYLLITNKSVVWFSFAVCLEPLSIGLLLILTYLLKKGPRLKFSSKVAKYLVKNSSPFILSGMISVLYATIDKIMLKEMFSSTEFVGIYNVAYNLSHSWVFLLSALISAFSPIIYEAYNKKDDSVSNLRSKQLYFIIFYTSFIVGILFSIVVPFAIPIMYTDAYVKSIVPSILLIFSIPFAYVGVARIIQITSENLQKYTIVFSILTVIINFILNFIFIPLLGVSGAALGTLLSEIFVCVIVPLFFKKTRHIGKNIIESLILKGVELKNIIKTLVASIKKGNKKNEKREEK